MLAYYFPLAQGESMPSAELDQLMEAWLARNWQYQLDFEIDDALDRLQHPGLAPCSVNRWLAAPG